jgi:hypothetical protein
MYTLICMHTDLYICANEIFIDVNNLCITTAIVVIVLLLNFGVVSEMLVGQRSFVNGLVKNLNHRIRTSLNTSCMIEYFAIRMV